MTTSHSNYLTTPIPSIDEPLKPPIGGALADRIGCAALIVAGPLCLIGGLLHPVVDGHAHDAAALSVDHTLGSWSLLLGTVALLLGFPLAYRRVADRLGVTGVVGFLLYFLGNLLAALPHLILMAFVADGLADHHPDDIADNDMIVSGTAFAAEQMVTGLMFLVGLLVLGVAFLRAGRDLRLAGALALAAGIVALLPLPAVAVLSGLQFELLRALFGVTLAVLAWRAISEQKAAK